jgi:hypothetical protein
VYHFNLPISDDEGYNGSFLKVGIRNTSNVPIQKIALFNNTLPPPPS